MHLNHNAAPPVSQHGEAQLADLLIHLMDAIERLSDRLLDIEIRHWVSVAEVMRRQERLYDLLVLRFNDHFRDDPEARFVWELFNILRGTPGAPFPADARKPRRTLPDVEA